MSHHGSDADALDAFVAANVLGSEWRSPHNTLDWEYLLIMQGVELVPAYIDTNGLIAGFCRIWRRTNYQGLYYCEVMSPDGQIRDRYFVWYDWGELPDGAEVIVIHDAADYRDWRARQGLS